MKKLLFILGIATLLMVTFYTSFESALPLSGLKQKGKPGLSETKSDFKDESISAEQKDIMIAEWKHLWKTSEKRLTQIEVVLSALKQKSENADKTFDDLFLKRIGELEDRNELLRAKLETYDLSEGHWKSYKKQYNLEMDELILDLEYISSDYHY